MKKSNSQNEMSDKSEYIKNINSNNRAQLNENKNKTFMK